jgi:energy-coupling factor transporter transmembrane protein EcfT
MFLHLFLLLFLFGVFVLVSFISFSPLLFCSFILFCFVLFCFVLLRYVMLFSVFLFCFCFCFFFVLFFLFLLGRTGRALGGESLKIEGLLLGLLEQLLQAALSATELRDVMSFLLACPDLQLVQTLVEFLTRLVADRTDAGDRLAKCVCEAPGPMQLYGLLQIEHTPVRTAALRMVALFASDCRPVSAANRYQRRQLHKQEKKKEKEKKNKTLRLKCALEVSCFNSLYFFFALAVLVSKAGTSLCRHWVCWHFGYAGHHARDSRGLLSVASDVSFP